MSDVKDHKVTEGYQANQVTVVNQVNRVHREIKGTAENPDHLDQSDSPDLKVGDIKL